MKGETKMGFMKKIDTTPKLFAPVEAERVAADLAANDEDWSYEADHDPKGTGYSRVAIFDEDGEFVAFFS